MSNHFLNPTQRQKLANYLNKSIDVPLISEDAEARIFRKIVDSFDKHLSNYVPDEFLEGLTNNFQLEDVITDALKDNLVPVISGLIPLPFVPSFLKEKILGVLVEVIVDILASTTTFDERIEELLAA